MPQLKPGLRFLFKWKYGGNIYNITGVITNTLQESSDFYGRVDEHLKEKLCALPHTVWSSYFEEKGCIFTYPRANNILTIFFDRTMEEQVREYLLFNAPVDDDFTKKLQLT